MADRIITPAAEGDDWSPMQEVVHGHDGLGEAAIEHRMDVEPVIDQVAAIAKATGGRSESGQLWHVGRIPYVVLMEYAKQRGIEWQDLMKPEYAPELMALLKANPKLSPTGGRA